MTETVLSKHGVSIRLTDERWTHITYDSEADVLYINFKKPSHATDSELLDNDVILRYENDQLIGITILHASER
ncbi:MAG: DUF2283 domain-containing protein [Desulfobacterales bacterium]|nr:DUF2283 domain-containing protein [Desulfobacterales bacterium]